MNRDEVSEVVEDAVEDVECAVFCEEFEEFFDDEGVVDGVGDAFGLDFLEDHEGFEHDSDFAQDFGVAGVVFCDGLDVFVDLVECEVFVLVDSEF